MYAKYTFMVMININMTSLLEFPKILSNFLRAFFSTSGLENFSFNIND